MADIKKLPLFVRCVIQNFPFIEEAFDALTNYQLTSKVVEYLNKVIHSQNEVINVSNTLQDAFVELKSYVENYFDNLDVQDEINNKLDEMVINGQLDEIIQRYLLISPQGMTLDLQRIGRKLFYTNDDGAAFSMQGGVKISDTLVAYALWDSKHKYPVRNRIIVMNITTGEIIRYADYSYGWCNSIAYHDGKLYIAERGKETDAEGHYTNTGVIHVLNADTLAEETPITMSFNVNSIYCYNGKFYLLQENTLNVYKYSSDLTTLEDTITIDADMVNYHQNICVDENFIYLISTQPSSSLNVFSHAGARIRTYNIKKYGGLYLVGEMQWIDRIDENGNFYLTSNIINENECIAQFFKINVKKNVDSKEFNALYAQTLYCDSETDYFEADGTQAKPFKSINEALSTSISNKVIRGQNKNYPYVYASDINFVWFYQCNFTEGIYAQYGKFSFQNCTFYKSINTTHSDATMFFRRATVIFRSCTFDGTGCNYIFKDGEDSTIKFDQPTFSGYATSVFNTTLPTSTVEINSAAGVPYIPRVYNTKFSLFANDINAYTPDDYNWTTSLSADQIGELFDNMSHILIEYKPLNKDQTQRIILRNRNSQSGNDYVITDFAVSSSSVSGRLSKIIIHVSKTKMTINSNVCQLTTSEGTSMVNNPQQNQLITILKVSLINLH